MTTRFAVLNVFTLLVLFSSAELFAQSTLPSENDGYVNVVRFGADPTGKDDSTQAFRNAYAYADSYADRDPWEKPALAMYVPTGTYVISDTFVIEKKGTPWYRGHVLYGSTAGPRPTIRLRDGAPGFDNPGPDTAKPMLHFVTRCEETQPASACKGEGHGVTNFAASNFGQSIRNIHLDCGAHNPGCVGLRFGGAQWSSIEDVSMDLTASGWAGLYDTPSRGWGVVNLEVTGGDYGVYITNPVGAVMVSVSLIDQRVESLRSTIGLPLTLVGFDITKNTGPVIEQPEGWRNDMASRALNLIDGRIELTGGGTAIDNHAGRNLYVRNVYIKGASTLIQSGGQPGVKPVGAVGTWSRIEEYAFADRDRGNTGNTVRHYRDSKVIVDGNASASAETVRIRAGTPPADLQSKHTWSHKPGVEDPGVCNVRKAPYKATGDGATDDQPALQRAVNECEKVFLPMGEYALGRTLLLGSKTQIFGVSPYGTAILHTDNWRPTAEVPMVDTVDDADATTWISSLSIRNTVDWPVAHDFFTLLRWRAGRRSRVTGFAPFRDKWIRGNVPENQRANDHSSVKITGQGGGQWYFLGSGVMQRTRHPNYHQFEIVGTTEPLTIYGMNPEHSISRVASLFKNVANVRVYGTKTEGSAVGWRFEDATNVAVYGWGANLKAREGRAMFELEDADDVLLVNLLPRGGTNSGNLLSEKIGPHLSVLADKESALALFKRGEIDDAAMDHARGDSEGNTPPPPDVCTAEGSTLNAARANFERDCKAYTRKDCDQTSNGTWLCSSENMPNDSARRPAGDA